MRLFLCLVGSLLAVTPLSAQGDSTGSHAAPASTAAHHVAAGDSAGQMHPDVALQHYQAALAVDSLSYEANWKAARAIADVAKQIQGKDDSLKHRRDSLYAVGRAYAERAIRADSTQADGHYALAMVLGRLSRTRGGKERVRFAKIIYDEATKAIEINPNHDNAHHVLGAWNAEVMRLSGIQKFFAKALFGGGFLSKGNWPDAVSHLEKAISLNPQHIYHRLELAQVFVDLDQYSKAREQLQVIPTLPEVDVLDHQYKQDAATLLDKVKDKKDKTS